MKDLLNRFLTAVHLNPLAHVTGGSPYNGATIDMAGYESLTFITNTGVNTDGVHTIKIQAADDSAFSVNLTTINANTHADLIGSLPGTNATAGQFTNTTDDNKVFETGYRGNQRYVRMVATVSGTTTGGLYSVTSIRGHARNNPA